MSYDSGPGSGDANKGGKLNFHSYSLASSGSDGTQYLIWHERRGIIEKACKVAPPLWTERGRL
jgi:hypothetical protein